MTEPRISPTEALRLMQDEGYTYLDVRTQTEFDLGHPAGAKNIPWLFERTAGAQPNPQFVQTVEHDLGRNAKLIVGCHTANRSAKAAAALRDAGFSNIFEQRSGWAGLRDSFGGVTDPGWEELGLPIERG
jgi:rhodanese-related sulfurtransferase